MQEKNYSDSARASPAQSLTSICDAPRCCFRHSKIPGPEFVTPSFSLPTKGSHNTFFIRLCTPTYWGKTWGCFCVCVSYKRIFFVEEAPQIIAYGIKGDLDPDSDLDVNTLWSKILELKIITPYCNHHCCFKNKSGWLESFHWKRFQSKNGSWIKYNFRKMSYFN